MDTLISLAGAFISIHDPRIDRAKKHNLVDIIMITLCATVAGMEGWEEIHATPDFQPTSAEAVLSLQVASG